MGGGDRALDTTEARAHATHKPASWFDAWPGHGPGSNEATGALQAPDDCVDVESLWECRRVGPRQTPPMFSVKKSEIRKYLFLLQTAVGSRRAFCMVYADKYGPFLPAAKKFEHLSTSGRER